MSVINKANLLTQTQYFQELKLKDYRNLLKCFLGDEIDPEFVFTNTNSILQKTCNLTTSEILNLNFIDYILLLLNLRSASIGGIIMLYAENDKKEQIQIELNIENIINNIVEKFYNTYFNAIKYNDIEIHLHIPTLTDILEFENKNLSINSIFINKIFFQKNEINFKNYIYTDREKIIKSLPVKLILLVDKNIETFLQTLNSINLLEGLTDESFDKILPLSLNSQILSFIIKLIYNADLESIYSNMFVLSKGANLNCEFLDNCSPGEFYIFIKKFEELQFLQHGTDNSSSSDLPPLNPDSQFNLE